MSKNHSERVVNAGTEEAGFSAGVGGLFEERCRRVEVFESRQDEFTETYFKEMKTLGDERALDRHEERMFQAGEENWAHPLPLWQQISGLYVRAHQRMSPNERAARIRKLLRRVERMLRWELGDGRKAESGGQKAEGGMQEAEDGERGVIGRTVFWTPVRTVCVYLEISQRHLSELCREITGMAIQEIVDRIKAERLRASFKERLKGFVLGWFRIEENRSAAMQSTPPSVAEEIFAALKAARRGVRFHRTQWAMELGYSSYQRLFRAALLSERMTPHQVEIEVIEGLVAEDEGTVCVGGQNLPHPPAPSPFHGEGENGACEGPG